METDPEGSQQEQPVESDPKPTSPTAEKRRRAEILYAKMQALQEEIDQLHLKPKVPRSGQVGGSSNARSTGIDSQPGSSVKEGGHINLEGENDIHMSNAEATTNSQKKVPFRSKFKKIPYDRNLPTRVVRLVHKVYNLSQTYDHMSLLCALDAALPHEMGDTYNETGGSDLMAVLNELMARYNSPTLLEEAEREILRYRGEQYELLSEKLIGFFAAVASFNKRCQLGGLRYKRRAWDRTRVFNFVCVKILRFHKSFRKEFFRLWTDKADKKDVESWSETEIRELITRAELLSTGGMSEYEGRTKSSGQHAECEQAQMVPMWKPRRKYSRKVSL